MSVAHGYQTASDGSSMDDDDGYETASEDGTAGSHPNDADAPDVGVGGVAGARSGGGEPSTSQASIRDRGLNEHGCEHYRRRCKLVAPCCGEVFWCRHCHNRAKDDDEQDPLKRHQLDRKTILEVVCALCDERQPVASSCRQCGVQFGRYTCLECHFYDDDTSKEQFHCAECGICRVGGRSNFFHCRTCNCCYATQLQASHVCVQNSMHQNCPVCFEYLFDSVRPIAVLPCGHTIHQECYHNLLTHDSLACPICLKSCINAGACERLWQELDAAVQAQPMPEQYRGIRVDILCNDCSERSTTLFHALGHKCGACGSYNTRRV